MARETFYCEVRERTGTSGAKAVRREGWVPGVLYGGGMDPVAIRLKRNEIVRALNTGNLFSQLVDIDVPGQEELQPVIARDVQFHPVKDLPVHIDMMRVDEKTRINVEVPVRFLNEETSPGLKKGGVLNIVRHSVEVYAPATAIPHEFEFDIGTSDVGDTITVSQTSMPKGVSPVITDRDFTIATIAAPSALRSSEGEADDDDGDAAETEAEGKADE